mmetsp:Transcript_3510/g.10885  ORF Transcript_3510/g.10885 Transcript_3510/m.10885 type:complete len:257 (-) Transcript_3510:377-1147(-)
MNLIELVESPLVHKPKAMFQCHFLENWDRDQILGTCLHRINEREQVFMSLEGIISKTMFIALWRELDAIDVVTKGVSFRSSQEFDKLVSIRSGSNKITSGDEKITHVIQETVGSGTSFKGVMQRELAADQLHSKIRMQMVTKSSLKAVGEVELGGERRTGEVVVASDCISHRTFGVIHGHHVLGTSLDPLDEVTTFAAAQVQDAGVANAVLLDQNRLHPVVVLAQMKDRTLLAIVAPTVLTLTVVRSHLSLGLREA